MADTITTNYHWVKPEISGSPTTWGVKVNADLDLIDATVFGISKVADTQIGMIVMFASWTPPPNWKLCDGTVYDNSDIPLLAPILNNMYGGVVGLSNAVPDMRLKFPTGAKVGWADPGDTGGEATHVLTEGEMPSHTHTASVTITDPGHDHPVEVSPHNHSGIVRNTASTGPSGGTSAGLSDAFSDSTTVGVVVDWNGTGITADAAVDSTGGDGSHNNLPPYLVLNFIIKFQ